MNSNPTDLTAALERTNAVAQRIGPESTTEALGSVYGHAHPHHRALAFAADLRALTQSVRASLSRPIPSGGGVYICTQCDVEIPLSSPPVARPVSGEIADGDQTAELCGLIFDNVKASVDHIGDDAIAVLSDVTAAAQAILGAGFRRQASDSASPGADVEAEVARILAMSDEEIMAEPGAAETASECGKAIARVLALHDIGRVRGELQAAYDDVNGAPGYRNFCGGLAERLGAALAPLAAGQTLTGKSEDGSSELMLCTTTCFECGHELHPPFCPACNPEIAALSQESQPDDHHLCASEDPYERCLECDCWKLTREMCS